MKKRQAFSFVELSVVIVLLAMLAAIIVPRLASIRGSQESIDFRNKLLNLSELARQAAMENQRSATLSFDDNNNLSYQLEETDEEPSLSEDQAAQQIARQTITVPESSQFTIFKIGDAEVSQSEWECTFYSNGTADNASLEFEQSGRPFYFTIGSERGTSRVTEGRINDIEPDSWPAGELEFRGS